MVNNGATMIEVTADRVGSVIDKESLKQLLNERAYPHAVDDVVLRETHISWLLLTGQFVYKIKRPVNFGFLDFSTLEKRRYFCEEEVRLNKRFAPDIYIDVVPITVDSDKITVDGDGELIEYAVKMRQFDESDLLQIIAVEDRFTEQLAQQLGGYVAKVHKQLPRCARKDMPKNDTGNALPVFAAMEQNFTQIRPYLRSEEDHWQLSKIEAWYRDWHGFLEPFLERRLDEGFVRECHGDLHLGNIALIDGRVTLFDCIEFNREFRMLDVLCELAFLEMDLDRYSLHDHANQTLNAYLEGSGDYAGVQALDFFRVYAALVRAKVTLLRGDSHLISPTGMSTEYRRYIELAECYCQRSFAKPKFLLMSGVSGTGKSTVAAFLAEHLGGIRIRSDVERQRLLGHTPNPFGYRVQVSGDAYSPEVTAQTYARLGAIAPHVLGAGFSCIVDATFSEREQRADFVRLAARQEIPIAVVYCHADVAELEQRIHDRSERGDDPSEATVEVLHQQLRDFEYPSTREGFTYLSIDTSRDDWQQQVVDQLHKFIVR